MDSGMLRTTRIGKLAYVMSIIFCASLAAATASAQTCPWKVKAVRHPTGDEQRRLDTRRMTLPESANISYGPDSLRLVVRGEHPHVYLDDLKTGKSELFVPDGAMMPSWSPDGKYVALFISRPPSSPGGGYTDFLSIIEFASRRRIVPLIPTVSTVMWAPDSQSLLASTRATGDRGTRLLNVLMPDGSPDLLDTTGIMDDYEFDWSPKQGWIVASRPSGEMHYGDVITSEVWIFSRSGDMKCKILDTPNSVEQSPQWIGDDKISVHRISGTWEEEEREDFLVVDLIFRK
jgi:hypothetical protein